MKLIGLLSECQRKYLQFSSQLSPQVHVDDCVWVKKPGSRGYRWTNNLIIVYQAASFSDTVGPYIFFREIWDEWLTKNVSVAPFNYLASECIPHQGQHSAILAKFWKWTRAWHHADWHWYGFCERADAGYHWQWRRKISNPLCVPEGHLICEGGDALRKTGGKYDGKMREEGRDLPHPTSRHFPLKPDTLLSSIASLTLGPLTLLLQDGLFCLGFPQSFCLGETQSWRREEPQSFTWPSLKWNSMWRQEGEHTGDLISLRNEEEEVKQK